MLLYIIVEAKYSCSTSFSKVLNINTNVTYIILIYNLNKHEVIYIVK